MMTRRNVFVPACPHIRIDADCHSRPFAPGGQMALCLDEQNFQLRFGLHIEQQNPAVPSILASTWIFERLSHFFSRLSYAREDNSAPCHANPLQPVELSSRHNI